MTREEAERLLSLHWLVATGAALDRAQAEAFLALANRLLDLYPQSREACSIADAAMTAVAACRSAVSFSQAATGR